MIKRLRIILLLITLSISLCIMSNTYSRYVADASGNFEVILAKWQILVNTIDITNNNSSTIEFEPVILTNTNVKANYMAPSSTGYFDIVINPTNVDVSFKYTITLNISNETTPDLMISKYAILPSDYIEGSDITQYNVTDNTITNSVLVDNTVNNFSFTPFTVRIYFEWYEGEDELMNDEADTLIGKNAATNNTTFTISANIQFEQII